METLGLSDGCILEAVETLGLSGGCFVEAVETLGLSGGCIVKAVETLCVSGERIGESVESLGLYGGCIADSVNKASVFLLKYRAPISLGCCSLVDISLGCSALGFNSSSSVSSEGVVRVIPLIVPNVADTPLDDTSPSLTSTSSILIKGEIAKGGGLLDPTVFCVDFLLLGSLLEFIGSSEELLEDRLRGEGPSSSGVELFVLKSVGVLLSKTLVHPLLLIVLKPLEGVLFLALCTF